MQSDWIIPNLQKMIQHFHVPTLDSESSSSPQMYAESKTILMCSTTEIVESERLLKKKTFHQTAIVQS